MLLIVSPFLAIIAVLVWLAVASLDILAAGRAYVEGESLWSKDQKKAVFHLLLFAKSGDPDEFQHYRNAIKGPLAFRNARLELDKPKPDYALARDGFVKGGTHPDDVPGVFNLYRRFKGVSYMQQVVDIWRIGDEHIAAIDAAAEDLAQSVRLGHSGAALDPVVRRIIGINEKLEPLEMRFSNTLGEATRWVQSVLLLVIFAVTGTLIPLGVRLTQRMVRQYAATLSYQASHDSLTGLINRTEFENRLKLALQTASFGRPHAVIYLDLDRFKIVNDTCGHVAGDQLLKQVGTMLMQQLREGDSLARLGGDEFGVLLENCATSDALRIADQLRLCILNFQFVSQGRSFSIGASIGLVLVADGMFNLTDVLSAADSACYIAKEKGRNRVQLYRRHDSEVSMRRGEMEWVGRLQSAIDDRRFVLYAQEIVPVLGDAPPGGHRELLLRMRDEQDRMVPPMTFLPAAERYGMMTQIDQWVIQNALSSISKMGPNCGIFAINISGMSIGDERFLEFVLEQFRGCSLTAQHICFEITETAAIANFHKAANFIGELKSLGCSFSLDDFGAGMSSFGYLKEFPVDFVKIDGSFVKNVASNLIDRAMVRAINDIGHVMGKKTIAEFVDGELGLAALRDIGVDFAQGYWISRPRPFLVEAAPVSLVPRNPMAVEKAPTPI